MPVESQFEKLFIKRFAPFMNPLAGETSIRKFLKLVPPKQRSGLSMSYPVQAAFSHGVTVTASGEVGTLNAARSGVDLEANLDATNLYMRDQLSYDSHMRGLNGVSIKGGDAAAYWKPIKRVVKNLQLGMEYYTEIALMFGCGTGSTALDDIGVVATTPVEGGTGPNYDSGTAPIVQLTAASWAAGLWNNAGNGGKAGSGMLVDILNAAGTATVETKVEIQGVVDPSLCQVKMSGGDTGSVAVAAGQRIVPHGWFQNQSVGIGGILANTGTFGGISAASNPFWRARTHNAGGAMTLAAVLTALAKLHASGLRTGTVGFIHALQFNDLVNNLSDLSRYNTQNGGSTGDLKVVGTDMIEFISPVGKATLVNHTFQKQGQSWFLPKKESVRVGASDITMRGIDDGKIFLELPDKTGSEIRSMCQQAPLIKVPAHALRVIGITPTGQDTSGS